MKAKILNLGVVVSSFLGYLEWGTDQSGFLIAMEWELIRSLIDNPLSILHPFILIPFAGQLLLLITLSQKKPNRLLSYLGIGALSLLMIFMLFIGVFSGNWKIAGSTLPFVVFAVLSVRYLRSTKQDSYTKL